MEHSVSLLSDIAYGILFATAASHVARWLRQPLILGYMLGGVLLGPHLGFGLVTNQESVKLISEIGLILLLFIIGLEIDLRDLANMGKSMFTLGLAQFLGCMALAVGFFSLWKPGNPFSLLYLSVALSLSSTLIAVKILSDKFEIHTISGRLTVGVLVIQDILAILFMVFQPNLSRLQIGSVLWSMALSAVLVALSFAASRYGMSRLFRSATKSPELVLLTSVAWCFAIAGLAEQAGLSKEMGALIAGLSIAAFPYGADVIAKVSGIRDFFVTLFFVSLGLQVPALTWELLGFSLLAAAFVIVWRLLSVAPTVYFLGKGLRNGFLTALNLSQISEFSLVILSVGAQYGHVPQELSSRVLASMLVTSILATYIIKFNDRLARVFLGGVRLLRWKEKGEEESRAAAGGGFRPKVVLLGCFRAGPAFLETVEEKAPGLKDKILVVDYNAALKDSLIGKGFRWAYGDLAHPETLQQLGIDQASVVICSVSDTFLKGITNRRLLGQLKRLAPQACFIMTADSDGEARRMLQEGAAHVIVSGKLAGERIFEQVVRIHGQV